MAEQATILTTEPAGPTKPETPAVNPERPKWLPEKFKSPEDLATAYAALESKLGGQKPAADPAKPAEAPKPSEAKLEIPAPAKGSTLEPFFKEFTEKGSLSEESLAKLEKQGLPRDVVQTYIEGYQAKAQSDAAKLLEPVGGAEAWAEVTTWASQSLSAEEQGDFNKVVTSGNMEAIRLAVSGLKARYDLSNGVQGQRLGGGNGGGGGTVPFKSYAQLVEAQKDPRYQKDPAYRQEVLERLSVSKDLL